MVGNSKIVKFLRKMKPYDYMSLDISNKVTDYIYKKKKGIWTYKPNYDFLYAKPPRADKIEFTIIDPSFSMSIGRNEICLRSVNKNSKKTEKKFPNLSNMEVKQELCIKIQEYNVRKVLRELKDKKILWKEILDYILDDTGTKDQAIKDVSKSVLLPMPLFDVSLFQQFNNHAFIITNTGVAKTTTFIRSGVHTSSDWSVPGLFGTFDKQHIPGFLSGSGPAIFDEFNEAESHEKTHIVNHLLNYLQQGIADRKKKGMSPCYGTKSIVFMGNCNTNMDYDDFLRTISFLTSKDKLDRIGRRFCHLLYGEYKQVKPTSFDHFALIHSRLFMNSLLFEVKSKLPSCIMYSLKWAQIDDKEYKKEINKMLRYVRADYIEDYMRGMKGAISNLKMAGIKAALMDNLDSLVTGSVKNVMKESVMPDAEEYYRRFKAYNLKSISHFIDKVKFNAFNLYESGKSISEIAAEIHRSPETIYKWVREDWV